MSLITIIAIAVGLGMDAFAVAIAVGSQRERLSFRPVFRLSFHFGLFQFMMPVIGWLVGEQVTRYISAYDHWVAFLLLLFIGGKMIYESFKGGDGPAVNIAGNDPTRKWQLILLSVATSIDALSVGFSLALLNIEIVYISVIIGMVAAAMTVVGMVFGRLLGMKFGRCMAFAGGLILIGIGTKILIEHIFLN
ncbi:MAG: manganese efflux pump MntP family protein [Candidatus Zixiibacteriota bacterium]